MSSPEKRRDRGVWGSTRELVGASSGRRGPRRSTESNKRIWQRVDRAFLARRIGRSPRSSDRRYGFPAALTIFLIRSDALIQERRRKDIRCAQETAYRR